MAASFARAQWHTYVWALERKPLLTKIATGVLGTVLGDTIAQHAARHMREADERRRRGQAATSSGRALSPTSPPPPTTPWRFDFARTARLCAYSALIGTPIAHYWFGLLDRGALLPAAARASAGLGAACKTLLDQLFMAPVGLSLFFSSLALMEGKTLPEAVGSAAARLKPALAANYALWPGAQAVNFALVPPKQRILYVNVVAIFWTAVLSHLASSEGGGAAVGGSAAAAADGGKEGPEAEAQQVLPHRHHHHHHHLPLPVPPEPAAAAAADAAAAAGGARRRGGAGRATAKQQQQQQQQQQQGAEADETPPDTFVPVVP